MARNIRSSSGRVRFSRAKSDKLDAMPDNWNEGIDDRVSAFLVAGDNVTLTHDDAANTLTISAASGGPGGTVENGSITNAKLSNVATATIKGRSTAGTGAPEDLTPAQVRTLLNVADGATANATNADLRDRSTHTGTQVAATITGLATVATTGAYDDLTGTPTIPGTNSLGNSAGLVPSAGVCISNALNTTALGTAAQVANRTVITPFIPGHNITIDQLGVSVSTFVASANVKCIIYDSDSNGRPTTVLRETANIDAGSNGTRFAAITSLTLTAGKVYWIGLRSSSTATLRTLGVGATHILSHTNAATPVAQGVLILTETFANAAATWTYASSQHSNVVAPLILMRVA